MSTSHESQLFDSWATPYQASANHIFYEKFPVSLHNISEFGHFTDTCVEVKRGNKLHMQTCTYEAFSWNRIIGFTGTSLAISGQSPLRCKIASFPTQQIGLWVIWWIFEWDWKENLRKQGKHVWTNRSHKCQSLCWWETSRRVRFSHFSRPYCQFP